MKMIAMSSPLEFSLELPGRRLVSWRFLGSQSETLYHEISRALENTPATSANREMILKIEVIDSTDLEQEQDVVDVIKFVKGAFSAAIVPGGVRIVINPRHRWEEQQKLWLMKCSILYATAPLTLPESGIIVHGALLTKSDAGILLTGSSGSGKTTCSRRATPPWQAWSDDMTLITRWQGTYYAQGMPTWSQFLPGRQVRRVNWNRSVRLKGILQLEHAREFDEIVELSHAERICTVISGFSEFKHTWALSDAKQDSFKKRLLSAALNFSGDIVRELPVARLKHAINGDFCKELDLFLQENSRMFRHSAEEDDKEPEI